MGFRRFILLIAGVFCAYGSFAQLQKGELVQSRILILLDESSSMIQSWAGGKEKYKAADDIILKLMDSVYAVNNQVEFSLRVFGHQSTVEENNCYDTKNEVPYAKDNKVQMSLRLADIHPLGVTPIAYSLQQAADHDLEDPVHNVYSIILITDGGESCGGDICLVMKKLMKEKVYFKPYILSLENDPTLKTTYACMGDFLQVTKEAEIPTAVGTIVEAFRPALRINASQYKEVQNIAANDLQAIAASAPSILKVSTPPIIPEKEVVPVNVWIKPVAESMVRIEAAHLTTIAIALAKRPTVAPAIVPQLPSTPPAIRLSAIKPAGFVTFNISTPAPVTAMPVGVAPLPPLKIDVPPPVEKLAKIKPAGIKQFNVIFVIEDHTLPQIKVPALPPLKIDPNIVKPLPAKPLPAKPHPTAGRPINYKVETEDNTETTVEIYFTNGHGKFYTTMPQVMLTDPATRGIVKKFYRTVDPAGNPDPQPDIPPGTYDLAFTAKQNLVIHNIEVQKNKKNKVIVTVNMTSLSFAYIDAANPDKLSDRPVSDFSAVVTERNKSQGRVQVQKCTDAIEYEPGNYHIEINTFPKEIRNVDLDFDDESVIRIAQPGFVKFTATDPSIRYITLYQRLGDKFLSFHKLDLNDPNSKHLSIQPGEYQAHYQKGPGQSAASEQVISFLVKTTEETEVIIK